MVEVKAKTKIVSKGVPPVSMLYNNNTTCYQMILNKEPPVK